MELEDIEMAFEYVSSNQQYINHAYISRLSGDVYYTSGMSDSDELPDDIDDVSIYASVPHKNDLNLGRQLVLDFASESLPDDYDTVYTMFSREGAYSRYKQLLENQGKLELWYQFENEKQKEAILEWCKDNKIQIDT